MNEFNIDENDILTLEDYLQGIILMLNNIESRLSEVRSIASDISETFLDETERNIQIMQNLIVNIKTHLNEETMKLDDKKKL